MKILANPVVLRAAVVLFCSVSAFLIALLFMRRLRKSIEDEADISSEPTPSLETLPLHLYNTVIQQLKQQKQELQVQSQAEQQRARTTETFSQAVLSNLSCGVLVFGTNGLVKTANPAAKTILGFASATGMGADDIFRGAIVRSASPADSGVFPDEIDETFDEPIRVADEVEAVLRLGCDRRQVEADYETPAGEKRFITVTVSPVPADDDSLLGVACLINDLTELEGMRRAQGLRGELSAEMTLQLRTSLTAIFGHARQLAGNGDPERAQQLASDIANEAAQLDCTLGGFLRETRTAQSVAAGASSAD